MRCKIFKRSNYSEYGYYIIEIPIKLIDYHNVLNKLTPEEITYLRSLYNSKKFDELDEKLLKFCSSNPGSSNYYISFRHVKIRKKETLNMIARRISLYLLPKSTTKLNNPLMSDYKVILNSKNQFYKKDQIILDLVKHNKQVNRSKIYYYSGDSYIAYCSLVLSREILWKEIKTT